MTNSSRPEYIVWQQMQQRCLNPNDKNYRHYGGRGITICARWRESFANFLADMGERPAGSTASGRSAFTLDRVDCDGNYEPANCRWTTWLIQNGNRTNATLIEYEGRQQSIAQWAREVGLLAPVLWNRLVRYGWEVDRAMRTPPRKKRRNRRRPKLPRKPSC